MSDQENQRRVWFDAYVARCEQGTIRPPSPGIRYPCPCCWYPTLPERGAYEICCLCNWEDDGQDDPHAEEVWGGPNGPYSLADARRNFQRHLIMYDPARPDKRIGSPDSPTELEAKRAMIAAFDAMSSTPDETSVGALWQTVVREEAVLNSETNRKAKEYEERHKGETSV